MSVAAPPAGAGRRGVRVQQTEAQHLVHFFFLDRFGEVVLGAEAHCLRYLTRVADTGEHDDFGRGLGFTDALQRLQTVGAGHHHVEHDRADLVGTLAQDLDRAHTAECLERRVAERVERAAQRAQHERIVVDDEDRTGALRAVARLRRARL